MDQKLTIPEITYMRALAGIKTDEELAKLMGKPVELISLQFSIMAGLPKRPEEKSEAIVKLLSSTDIDPSLVTAPVIKEKKKPAKEKQEKKPHSSHAQALERLKVRKDKHGKSIYKTRKLDLTGKVPFKLNNRTTVYAPPGTDVDQLKIKYKIT